MKFALRLLLIPALAISGGLCAMIPPTFHLKNNSKDTIQINIIQDGSSVFKIAPVGLRSVAKGGEFPFQLDISKPTTLEIGYCPTADYCKTSLPAKMIAKIKAGKTVYIKFDGKTIEPQKGDILGKTTKGYSTKNNVDKGDMKVEGGGTKKSELGIGGKKDSQQIENEAWSYFPITAQDRLMADTLPDQFWIKVQDLNYNAIISLSFDLSYAPILQSMQRKYEAKMAEVNRIQNPQIRKEAQEIAATALEKSRAFIQSLIAKREAIQAEKNRPQQTKPAPTTAAETMPYQSTAGALTSPQKMSYQALPASHTELTGIGKTALGYTYEQPTQEAQPMMPELIEKTGPVAAEAQPPLQTKPATRIAPSAPKTKQAQTEVAPMAQKTTSVEPILASKTAPQESEVAKPDAIQMAWQEFPSADLLRKKLKKGDQSPFVARQVLGLPAGATESDINKKAKNLEGWYLSRSYRGDMSIVPQIIAIITQAKTVLIDAIYPPLGTAVLPFAQELRSLFFAAPDGFEDFAAPIYQDLMATQQYSREFLQNIQTQVRDRQGLPTAWRQSVLSKLQSRIK